MPLIHVCALSRVAATARETGARSLVTLLKSEFRFERPATIAPERHLHIAVSDVVEDTPGHVAPARGHVERLVDFARRWDRREPLLIHCFAGVSRSTAAAFIAVCALAPARSEREIAEEIRRLSPTATPNPLLARHADEVLGRGGRMVEAIAAIGRGAECFEGVPFALSPD